MARLIFDLILIVLSVIAFPPPANLIIAAAILAVAFLDSPSREESNK